MIQKLRRKLTLLVLGGLLLVLVGTVASINGLNWSDLVRRAEDSLQALTDNGGRRPGAGDVSAEEQFLLPPRGESPGQPGRDRSFASLSNCYTILLDGTGAVVQWSSDRAELYSDEQIAELAETIWKSGAASGRQGSQFYQTAALPEGGTLAVVLDARMEVESARALLKTTVLVGVLAYLVLGLGAVVLIRRMTRPVQEAFDKQRQFVWDASHELKTPLAVISANAEVLAGEIGENEWLGYIRSEVRRTDKLVKNLLTLARMDQGTVQAERRQFDLSQAVLQVALPFESTVFEAGKTMELEVPEGLSYVGDQEMLQQLVVILLSNAVKYSDAGGTIALSLQARGEKRVLQVSNTGDGIAPEALPRIFDRFYRGDSAHNRENPGNGLGLAIAKTLVEAHKGRITAENLPDRGVRFTVVLP